MSNGKYTKNYILENGKYDFRVDCSVSGTRFTCKHCKTHQFNLTGVYSELDSSAKQKFNATLDAYHSTSLTTTIRKMT